MELAAQCSVGEPGVVDVDVEGGGVGADGVYQLPIDITGAPRGTPAPVAVSEPVGVAQEIDDDVSVYACGGLVDVGGDRLSDVVPRQLEARLAAASVNLDVGGPLTVQVARGRFAHYRVDLVLSG